MGNPSLFSFCLRGSFVFLHKHGSLEPVLGVCLHSQQAIIITFYNNTAYVYIVPILKRLLGVLSTSWFIICMYLLINMTLYHFKGLCIYSC